MSKRVLILTITAGQGHNSTAKAICKCLESEGASTQTLDVGYYYSKLVGHTIEDGYILSVENAKHLYRRVYRHLEQRPAGRASLMRLANRMICRKLRKYIDNYDPDVIICTHVFPAMILQAINRTRPIQAHMIGILTDFAFHPYWEESTCLDEVIVTGDMLIPLALRKGYRAAQIRPLGIPINPRFSETVSQAEAKERMGLSAELPVVLVMGGSMGYGHMTKTVETLDRAASEFQIVVVCGSNEEMKKKVDELCTRKPIVTFGFTTEIPTLMDAATVIVTKPGGLTSSEALAKGLPMIIVNPIPGQEERNAEYLLNLGAAMQANDMFTVDLLVDALLNDPERLRAMQRAAKALGKPDATVDLCRCALSSGRHAIVQ